MELSTYFRINTAKSGQFERTLIVADESSYVSYLEGCTAPMRDENQLHAAVVNWWLLIMHKLNIQQCKTGTLVMRMVAAGFLTLSQNADIAAVLILKFLGLKSKLVRQLLEVPKRCIARR